jgi:hypothetical protein
MRVLASQKKSQHNKSAVHLHLKGQQFPLPSPVVPAGLSQSRCLSRIHSRRSRQCPLSPIRKWAQSASVLRATLPSSLRRRARNRTSFLLYFTVAARSRVFALAVDDDGKLIAIMENGKVTTMKEIQVLAFRIVLGSERYEKLVADGWRVEEDPAAR